MHCRQRICDRLLRFWISSDLAKHYHRVRKHDGASSDVDKVLLLLEEVALCPYEVLKGMWISFVDLG
jgi:hypothetical protein